MLFHTWTFLIFFLIVYPVYLLGKGTRFEKYWLLAASWVFYGWWNPAYLLLMVFSTFMDYWLGRAMGRWPRHKGLLVTSVVTNMAILGFFKYGNFIADNLEFVLRFVFPELVLPRHTFLLPVGISFYTFQSMSYTIDVYRQQLKPERNFVRFALYVAYFPQLVAGPIERATHLLPQFLKDRAITREHLSTGVSLFVVGLFKKLALADFLAMYVDQVYGTHLAPQQWNTVCGAEALLATWAFAWQIYFDFSGYSDMARGLARVMGFDIMENFHSPYVATNPSDFWHRWHISLSTWLRDYLYIPLGGNRCSSGRMYANLFLTMLLGGIWHGNTWNFAIWGALHGLYLVVHKAWMKHGGGAWLDRVPLIVRQAFFFNLVALSWVFFRAASLDDSLEILHRICFHFSGPVGLPWVVALLVCVVFAVQRMNETGGGRLLLEFKPLRVCAFAGMLVYLALFSTKSAAPFIYFQF